MGRHVKRGRDTFDDGSTPVSEARELGTKVATQARRFLTDVVARRLARLAEGLGKLAQGLRASSPQLDANLGTPYVGRTADQLERAAHFLRRADGQDVFEAVKRFARARPILFVGSALAMGLGAGRFLKSSAQTAPDHATEQLNQEETSHEQTQERQDTSQSPARGHAAQRARRSA